MYKYSILLISLTLAACSSSDTPIDTNLIPNVEGLETGNIPGVSEDGQGNGVIVEIDTVTDMNAGDIENVVVGIVGEGLVDTINNIEKTDLTISGANHTVNVESDIGNLFITGSNSIVRFAANVTVDTCTVGGSDNTAERSENVTLNCTVGGVGNIGFE